MCLVALTQDLSVLCVSTETGRLCKGTGIGIGVSPLGSSSPATLGPRAASKQSLSSLLQFDCTNTLNDQTLENVTVQMEPTEAYEVLCYVPARSLPYNQPGTCYTLVALPKEDPTAGEHLSRNHPGLVGALGIQMGWAGCTPDICLL